MGGTDDAKNLVNLTAKEHFLAHMLLTMIHPKEWKLKVALHFMSLKETTSAKNLRIGARTYERLKIDFLEAIKNRKYNERDHWGEGNHNYGRFWIKNKSTGHDKMISEGEDIPEGYEKGRFNTFGVKHFKTKGHSWYNNGKIEKLFIKNKQDNGFTKGRLPLQRRKRRKDI